MFAYDLSRRATDLLALCRKKKLTLATAESCTGGLLSALLTDIPGASDVFDCGFVTYSYGSKTGLLGVDAALIEEQGAVSDQVAAAMVQGALDRSGADVAVALTGIAGPGGGTPQKPVGLVYIAVATRTTIIVENNHFTGTRTEIRVQSITKAMEMLNDMIARSFVYTA